MVEPLRVKHELTSELSTGALGLICQLALPQLLSMVGVVPRRTKSAAKACGKQLIMGIHFEKSVLTQSLKRSGTALSALGEQLQASGHGLEHPRASKDLKPPREVCGCPGEVTGSPKGRAMGKGPGPPTWAIASRSHWGSRTTAGLPRLEDSSNASSKVLSLAWIRCLLYCNAIWC